MAKVGAEAGVLLAVVFAALLLLVHQQHGTDAEAARVPAMMVQQHGTDAEVPAMQQQQQQQQEGVTSSAFHSSAGGGLMTATSADGSAMKRRLFLGISADAMRADCGTDANCGSTPSGGPTIAGAETTTRRVLDGDISDGAMSADCKDCHSPSAAGNSGPAAGGLGGAATPPVSVPVPVRRSLRARYISNAAMRADSIPCSVRGGTAANCRPGGGKPANRYTRGCTVLQQCARNIN